MTHDRSELEALLGRVENATGPDAKLDGPLARTLLDALNESTYTSFTGSIDACLTLCELLLPELAAYHLARGSHQDGAYDLPRLAFTAALVVRRADAPWANYRGENAQTMPLAILIALLRALIAESHPAEPLKHMPA